MQLHSVAVHCTPNPLSAYCTQAPYTTVTPAAPGLSAGGAATATLPGLMLRPGAPAMTVHVSLTSYDMRLGVVSAVLEPGRAKLDLVRGHG